MLAELAIYAFSPARLSIRRVGLFGKAVALWSRATRCRAAWAPHEGRCRALILRAVARLERRRTALVLGSGLCRDVPLADLAAAFDRVVLIDAVHLWPVRLEARRHGNVELRSRDLTGAVDWLLGRAEGRVSPLADFQKDETVDLVVSANLLSQLPLGLDGWLDADEKRVAHWGEDFSDRAIGWHLDDLAGFACPVCLVTDSECREEAADGRVLERFDLLCGASLPAPDGNWEWEVAPFGEEARGQRRIHHVRGYEDIGPALRRSR